MVTDATRREAADGRPPGLLADPGEPKRGEFRTVRDYVEERLAGLRSSIADWVEPGPGEEILDVIELGAYTLVVKRRACAEGCDDCSHRPCLYRVRRERLPNGEAELQWSYLGALDERARGD